MYFPIINDTIASWQSDPPLFAMRAADETSFYVEQKEQGNVLFSPMKNVRGWASLDKMWLEKQQKFYKSLQPLFSSDRSWVILSLFIKKIFCERRGRVAGFLDNKKINILFFPEEGPPVRIQKVRGLPIFGYEDVVNCTAYWGWIKGQIDECSDVSWTENILQFQSITSHIVIKTILGKKIIIEAEGEEPVGKIKRKIENKEGIPHHQQKLMREGRGLEDDHTLAFYGIRSGCALHLVLSLRGGGMDLLSFNNMQEEKKVDLVDASNESPWLFIYSGLNLEGRCNNQNCEANGQRVWMPKGFGIFNMHKECAVSLCPQCNEMADAINNCGFTRCTYSIEGETQAGEERKRVGLIALENEFLTYASGRSTQNWRKLIITTQR